MSAEIHELLKCGNEIIPITNTDAVTHTLTGENITKLFNDYNVSLLYPKGGIDGSQKYNLTKAIQLLETKLSSESKLYCNQISFLGENNVIQIWGYRGDISLGFSNLNNWYRKDIWYTESEFGVPEIIPSPDQDIPENGGSNDFGESNVIITQLLTTISDLTNRVLDLEKAVFPLELSFNIYPDMIEYNVESEIYIEWSAKRKGLDITELTEFLLNNEDVSGSKDKSITLTPTNHDDLVYKLRGTCSGLSDIITKIVRVESPNYFGIVDKDFTGGDLPKLLYKHLIGSREFKSNPITLDQQKLCYAYPTAYGELSSITDGTLEYLDSYDKFNTRIGLVDYNVYVLRDAVTITGFKQWYK